MWSLFNFYQLDVFLILQSQTTKERDGGGDLPLSKNAAYGGAQFDWYADYIVTIWRPLLRVQSDTDLRVTGWQYGKIRNSSGKDSTSVGIKHLLNFHEKTGDFSEMTLDGMNEFNELIKIANQLRKQEEKKETSCYYNSPSATSLKKKIAMLNKIEYTKRGE